jgi:hypothetical protein
MNARHREFRDRGERAEGLDLEEFRLARGLSYRKLASLIGSNHASQTRAWALGEARPDADQLDEIVKSTNGAVTIEAMHRRRLSWLMNKKSSVRKIRNENARSGA